MSVHSFPYPRHAAIPRREAAYRDAIVFFRMGDFYEMFYEDALVAARALDLTLTSRSKDAGGNGIPMCGIPFHAVDGYLRDWCGRASASLSASRSRIRSKAKGLVKREVVRVVSPGTLTDANYLDAREPAFLMAIVADPDLRSPAPGAPAMAALPARFRCGAARSLDRRIHGR